jgi:hypothetical protein
MKKSNLFKTIAISFITLSASLFVTKSAQAFEPILLNGIYTFNSITISQVRDVELVPSMNTARYTELVKDKYQCSLRGDYFYCQKFIKGASLPQNIELDVMNAWRGKFFDFLPTGNFPTVTNESDSLFEWDIHDQVTFGNSRVSEYHYYVLKNDSELHKISLDFSTGKEWLVVENDTTLSMSLQKTQRISTFQMRIFLLSLAFVK